ncbi:hypothetical protein D9613_009070 [Agrocybe pediades]|uniref:CxC2-like cysteine cluster KDZ transposase-associated domain-containing protein n=1 Tax=Agrocybe pediades TaxID=84607 RepID=A0A8H4R539_9AGAR|nr:hypothetical protein D9613_009070 [Agrocybe pediades]
MKPSSLKRRNTKQNNFKSIARPKQSQTEAVAVPHKHVIVKVSNIASTVTKRIISVFKPSRNIWDSLYGDQANEHHSNSVDLMDYPEVYADDLAMESTLQELDNSSATTHAEDVHPKKRARTDGDNPLKEWARIAQDHDLHEILRMEGRGDFSDRTLCYKCELLPAVYRCVDCEKVEMFCRDCVVQDHQGLPLHRIQKWNERFFERSTLKELGLRVQLGHFTGEACANPEKSAGKGFTVIHSNGIHDIALDYCGCEKAQPRTVQLLRRFWYPATGVFPQTAATVQVLKSYRLLAFEAKTSTYEFYNSLARLTDNTGLLKHKERYHEFMRMYRQWCILSMAKRAGRGHDEKGITATSPGECAVLCPACPQPEKNMPSDWKEAPPSKKWLYSLFLAIDANFRLTRRHVSTEERDPSLMDGWSFFVKHQPYAAHLKKYWKIPQPKSTCVNHNAVNNADTEVRGKAVTGAGTVDCARHDMKRPCAFGDLQKGERYLNMDYIFFSSLCDTALQQLVISYDIACQWHKNIWDRTKILPEHLRLSTAIEKTTFLVPKFHIGAHIAECNLNFSFNLTKGTGTSDGEAPERGWSHSNALATSTREMAPGFRRETLDSHFNDWNWKKVVGLGGSLLKKMDVAIPALIARTKDFVEFETEIAESDIEMFRVQVEAWEGDITKPNPYEQSMKCITEKEIRLELANEAAAEAKALDAGPSSQLDTHPSVFIAEGLDLERQQIHLKKEAAGLSLHPTVTQLRKLQESVNRLQRRISNWMATQAMYMPYAVTLRQKLKDAVDSESEPAVIKVQDIPLFLPSALVLSDPCDLKLRYYEWKLRKGQAFGALHDIRRKLRLKSYHIKMKMRFSRGVAQNTRSNDTINQIEEQLKEATVKYRTAYKAIRVLDPHIPLSQDRSWAKSIQELKDEDLRGMSEGKPGESAGKQSISWIWRIEGVAIGDHDEQLKEALRIEWCRARARAMRLNEEVELVQEEMRRVLAFLEWQAKWWSSRPDGSEWESQPVPAISEGMRAYKYRQAALREALQDQFKKSWEGVPKAVEECMKEIDEIRENERRVRNERARREEQEGPIGVDNLV